MKKSRFTDSQIIDALKRVKRPGFRGGSNTGEWSHEEVLEVFA